MAEVPASKSSPEPYSDQSDGSENITANEEGTSEQGSIAVVATTSSDENKPDWSCGVNGEPQTSAEGDSVCPQMLSDSDEDSTDTNNLYRFSDNELVGNEGSPSSNNYESSFEEVCHTTYVPDKPNTEKENMIKKNQENKANSEEDTEDSSSDEEAGNLLKKIAFIDGGESSNTKDVFAGIWSHDSDFTSSDEEAKCTISQMKATIHDGGECSKTKDVYNKGTDPFEENHDQSSSDDDIKYTPSYEHAYFHDGGVCIKTEDVSAGPSKEIKQSSHREGVNIPSNANTNDDKSTNTEIVVAGPSNAGQAQVRQPTKNKAERKMNYTVPFKKSKKF